MLNNTARNTAYQRAITNAIQNQHFTNVLDIGTGTGLLSIYAYQAGATCIVACEESPVMHEIAADVFRQNQLTAIQLIGKSSLDLDYLHANRFDLIVTEILDSGVFGEGILETLIHAKRNLLSETGLILPKTVVIFVCGYTSDTLTSSKILRDEKRFDECGLRFDKVKMVGRTNPYWVENLSIIGDFRVVTTLERGMVVNFNDFNQIVGLLTGEAFTEIKMMCLDDGGVTVDGFAVWFQLYVDESNSITTHPSPNNCWDQGLFKLNQRKTFAAGDILTVRMSAKDGLLALDHEYNMADSLSIEINPDTIKYLNDDEYLSQLDCDFNAEYPERCFGNVLDFSPFPFTTLKLLIANRIESLHLPIALEPAISAVFTDEEIRSRIKYFYKFPIETIFELVFLMPVLALGDLNSEQIVDYSVMRLNETIMGATPSIVIPAKIRTHCELIHSDWLKDVTRITNPEIARLNITQQINRYKTLHQLEMMTNVDYEVISEMIMTGCVAYDDEFRENVFDVQLRDEFKAAHVDGILYHFQFKFTENSDFVMSSRRDSSFLTQAAFINYVKNDVENDTVNNVNDTTVKMRFIQNNGIIKFEIV